MSAGRAHKHNWNVVMVGAEPVGISCRCGQTRPVAEREEVKASLSFGTLGTTTFTVATGATTTYTNGSLTWNAASSGSAINGVTWDPYETASITISSA